MGYKNKKCIRITAENIEVQVKPLNLSLQISIVNLQEEVGYD
jgi:hypothetical protein